jgi:hypothetical protein
MQSSSLRGARLPAAPQRQQRASRGVQHVVRAAKVADGPRVAIVGVTGAVGQEFLRVRKPIAPATAGPGTLHRRSYTAAKATHVEPQYWAPTSATPRARPSAAVVHRRRPRAPRRRCSRSATSPIAR